MEAIETYEQDGFTVRVYQDEEPGSPAEWDQLGELVACDPLWREYRFAERVTTSQEDRAIEDGGFTLLARYLCMTEGAEVLPFTFQDYGSSGARLYEAGEDTDRLAGFIVCDRAKIIAEYGDDSPANREKARTVLSGELKEWGQYVEGDVYGYMIAGPDGEDYDSLWGMYGWEYVVEEARAALAATIEGEREEARKIAQSMAL